MRVTGTLRFALGFRFDLPLNDFYGVAFRLLAIVNLEQHLARRWIVFTFTYFEFCGDRDCDGEDSCGVF